MIFLKRPDTKLRSTLTKDIEYVQGLQLNEINIYLALTDHEHVNRALMKETRARTHVSVLFGHEGSFPVCIWS